MDARKIIAVVGATGAQGGGLARAILADPGGGFAVRALTRNAASDKARGLAAAGAEVVVADTDDLASVARAFAGAYGAYAVTNYWEHFSTEREKKQMHNIAQAAKSAHLQHVVMSTLEDTRRFVPLSDGRMPTLQEKYKVPHFDAKGESEAYFRELGVPTTFLLTTFYWENLIYFGMNPKKGDDGTLQFTLPMGDVRLAGIAAEDIGRCAYGVFKQGLSTVGQTIGIAGDHVNGAEMAAVLSKVLGQPVRHFAMTPEAYRSLGFPGADDLGNMFQFYRDFPGPFLGARSIETSRRLNPALQSFATWVAANKERIPLS
jgi:uncharacterized protein YbjT (DUF2867 family)